MTAIATVDTLVFEGGGVKGLAYLGAISVFEAQYPGFLGRIRHVGGTSAGALTALLIALGASVKELERDLSIKELAAFNDGWSTENYQFGMFNSFMRHYGLSSGKKLQAWVRGRITQCLPSLADPTFADLQRHGMKDLHVFAVCLNDGSCYEFSAATTPNTSVALAVQMSMAFPRCFTVRCGWLLRVKTITRSVFRRRNGVLRLLTVDW